MVHPFQNQVVCLLALEILIKVAVGYRIGAWPQELATSAFSGIFSVIADLNCIVESLNVDMLR